MLAFAPSSQIAHKIDLLFYILCGICALLMVAITVLLVVFIVHYHRKRHAQAVQIKDSMALELTWTIIPTILVMGMFAYGWEVFKELRTIPKDAMPVKVVGRQWAWDYEYANGARRSGKEGLIIPLGKPVVLKMTSSDVIHSYYIPAFRIKEDVLKDRETYLSFTPDAEGEFDVFCAEYCGGVGGKGAEDGHWSMTSKVVVVQPEVFDRWYAENAKKK